MRSVRTSRAFAVVAVLAIAASACSRETISTTNPTTSPTSTASSVPASTAPTTTTATTATTVVTPTVTTTTAPLAASTTTEAPTTTVAPTTTAATTTTTEPPLTAAGLTLASNGVLPLIFGGDDDDVIAGLTTALGAPSLDSAQTYPLPDGAFYLDATGEELFIHPIGRTVCFANDLCAQFGGPTVDALTFTGWRITSDVAPQLFTVEGISVGSVMSDHVGTVALDGGGCYSVGFSHASGVELVLLSSGEPFGSFDAVGNYVIGNPLPADVTVLSLNAGELPVFLFEDC